MHHPVVAHEAFIYISDLVFVGTAFLGFRIDLGVQAAQLLGIGEKVVV